VRRRALVWFLFIACWQAGVGVFSRGLAIPLSGNYLARATVATASLATTADGNLLADGLWTYTWDAENRLSSMQSLPAVADEAKRRLDYAYDADGRRFYSRVSVWSPTRLAYRVANEERYWYNGWSVVGRSDLAKGIVQTMVWGLDLSATPGGAGGVGGLLRLNDLSNGTFYYAYDGNGNVLGLVDATNGAIAAQYDYGPFGEPLRADGPMAQNNPFRFSTKFQEPETGLLYYGYRHYNPTTGRWINRDPIGENGGVHVYGFVGNSPLDQVDPFGLAWIIWGYYIGHAPTWVDSNGKPQYGTPPGDALQAPAAYEYGDGIPPNQMLTPGVRNNFTYVTGGEKPGQFVMKLADKVATQSADNAFLIASGIGEEKAVYEVFTALDEAAEASRIAKVAKAAKEAQTLKACKAAAKGTVALDSNALMRGLEKGELAALDAAIAGRVPTISITAAKEFLRKGDINVLREFLASRGGSVGQAATELQIAELQAQAQVLGRVLRAKDAAVVGSAINEGATVITRDQQLLKFLNAAGIPVQAF
jgi:RHS repeat-associated protein